MILRIGFLQSRLFFAVGAVALLLVANAPQSGGQQQPPGDKPVPQTQSGVALNPSADGKPDAPEPTDSETTAAKQSKRILWIFPNYRAVSANTQLPPLSLRDKFWLATQDSFDYSSFVTAALLAGVAQARNSTPEFGEGAEAYGRYYWHSAADQAVGNYMTEAIFPALAHEDPRYYTLGQGGFFKRSGYALSRLLITRTDSGRSSFNFSEILGNGAGAGISNAYYPSKERTWTKTGQKWAAQIGLDGAFNILKEFWPDLNRTLFHGKY